MRRCRLLFRGFTLLMLIMAPWQSASAQEKKPAGFKPDVQNPQFLPQSNNGLCPPGAATLYISGAKICAKCNTDYAAVEDQGKVVCIRERMHPMMREPDGYQPEFKNVDSRGDCPYPLTLITLHGRKFCVQCKAGYRYHDYYGQGRCVTCNQDEPLGETGGKIMCLKCPGNSKLVGTYPPSSTFCACDYPMIFGWGDKGYGCYPPPGH